MNASLWSISAWNGKKFIDWSELIMHLWRKWWRGISRYEMYMYFLDLFMECLDLRWGEILSEVKDEIWVVYLIWRVAQSWKVSDLYASSFHEKSVCTRVCLKKNAYCSQGFWRIKCTEVYTGLSLWKRVCTHFHADQHAYTSVHSLENPFCPYALFLKQIRVYTRFYWSEPVYTSANFQDYVALQIK